MTTPLKTGKSTSDLETEGKKRELETGYYSMTVDYSNGEACMVFDQTPAGVTEDSETMADLSSNDFEIDISPTSGDDEDLMLKNRELECVVHDLKRENEMLKMKVSGLEEEVSRLKSTSENIPLPTLYVQLNTVRKQVSDLEKRNQELESENMELNLRLEKKDYGEIYCENQDGYEPNKSPLARRRSQPFSRTASTPVCQSVPSKLTKQQTLQTEEFEAAKLDFAEKLGKKEEMIEKLKEQLEASAEGLNGLGDGIDALEQRIEHQLTAYHAEVSEKFEGLLKTLADIQTCETDIDRRATAMQTEIQEMLKSYASEIEELNSKCQSLQEDKGQEVEELELMLENKTQNLEEAKHRMESMSEEEKRQEERITELENTIEELEFKISSMKTQRLVPDGLQGATESKELEAMRERISQLESSLSEEQKKNEALLKSRNESEGPSLSLHEEYSVEGLMRENKELKKELLEVSEKLVDVEEQNTSLKDELENHSDFFGQCLSLEEELEANKRINRGLVDHLNRRKKRNENLQKELDVIRQQIGELEGGRGRKRTKEHKAVMSNLMEEMILHEKRYEELDKILTGVQAERDGLLHEKASLNKMMHSLIKENKVATQALEKLRSEKPAAQERLEESKKEVTRLQAQLKVETLARKQAGKSDSTNAVGEDIMDRLVASQISIAEMDERMLKLRKELHKSVARNMYLISKSSRMEKQLQEKRSPKSP